MATRKVSIKDTERGGALITKEVEANTLGELKAALGRNFEDKTLTARVGSESIDLVSNDQTLPTGDFMLFVFAEKAKSGLQ